MFPAPKPVSDDPKAPSPSLYTLIGSAAEIPVTPTTINPTALELANESA